MELSTTGILAIISTSVGIVVLSVPVFKLIAERIDQRKESDNSSIVSRTKKREISAFLIKIDRSLYLMEKGFEAKYHVLELEAMFKALKKQFIELEDLMT